MSQRIIDQLYTAEEFEKMPEFNERYELINGRLVEKPMPKFEHSEIVWRIQRAYFLFDPDEKIGVLRPEVSVRIGPEYTPAPDLSFWVANRAPAKKIVIAPYPDLAIEVQSEGQGTKGLLQKAKDYLKAGVRIVWVIQPGKQIVAVFRQGATKPVTLQSTGKLEGEDVILGFDLPVKALFD